MKVKCTVKFDQVNGWICTTFNSVDSRKILNKGITQKSSSTYFLKVQNIISKSNGNNKITESLGKELGKSKCCMERKVM